MSIGPPLWRCDKCGFGYAGPREEHTDDNCKHAQEQSANPCGTCGHGKDFHSDDGTMCVQAIAGDNKRGIFPGFCRCAGYTS